MPKSTSATLSLIALSWASLSLAQAVGAPAKPTALPEATYPNCALSFQQIRGFRGKLATLRHCRTSTLNFRETYLRAYQVRLANYANSLERYRQLIDGANLPEGERAARLDYYEAEKAQLQPGGELYEAQRTLNERSRGDLEFVGQQICSLLHRRGNRCQ